MLLSIALAAAAFASPTHSGGSGVPRAAIRLQAPAVTPLDTLTSGLASIARLPFGTDVASELRTQPPTPTTSLVLYEFEGCGDCRRVREVSS